MRTRPTRLTILVAVSLSTGLAVVANAAEPARKNWSGAFASPASGQGVAPLGNARNVAGAEGAAGSGITLVASVAEQKLTIYRGGAVIGIMDCLPGTGTDGPGAFALVDVRRLGLVGAEQSGDGDNRVIWREAAARDPSKPGAARRGCQPAFGSAGAASQALKAGMPVIVSGGVPVFTEMMLVAPQLHSSSAATPLALELLGLPADGAERAGAPRLIVISAADRKVYVMRGAGLVAELRIAVRNPRQGLGEGAFSLLEPVEKAAKARWLAIGLSGNGVAPIGSVLARIEFLDPDRARDVLRALGPGTVVAFSDQPAERVRLPPQRRVVTTSGERPVAPSTSPKAPAVKPSMVLPSRPKLRREMPPVPERMSDNV